MANYKIIMQKMMEQMADFKREIDDLADSYELEKQKFEKELESMKGKFTAEYVEESRKNWKPKLDYKKIIDLARKTHQTVAQNCLDELKSQLDHCFQIPVDSGFAATISAIDTLGLTLNNTEFKVLEGAANGYWSRRLLSHLGTSRTTPEQRTVIENGEPKAVDGERKTPYPYVNLPDIEKAYDSLQNLKNAVNMAFEAYCGKGYALKDIIFPPSRYTEETNAKIKQEYGINSPAPIMDTMQISKMASSVKCFDENYHCYTEFSEMMDGLMVIIPKSKKKKTLTDNDRKLIDRLIDPRFPTSAKSEAVELARLDQHLAEILSLDSRYSEVVRKISGGENNE